MKTRLLQIAEENNFKIMYACESGSRVWGFDSPDSDYDIRFIYVQPFENYLTLRRDVKDTFNITIDKFDISGWDIKKAMNLFMSTNPSLFEWLRSPDVYVEPDETIKQLQKWAHEYYNPIANMGHYYSMTMGHYNKYVADKKEINIKKYLYTIRSALAVNWIKRTSVVPPLNILTLVHAHGNLRHHVHELVQLKRQSDENTVVEVDPEMSEFVRTELYNMPSIKPIKKLPLDHIDNLFRQAVIYNAEVQDA